MDAKQNACWSETLARLTQTLRGGWARFLLLSGFALALHGHTMSYGLVYDDAGLLGARHLAWITGPWFFETYYRPLQALLFSPHLVSAWAPFLHLQNLLAGTFVVFLFGRVLQRTGFATATAIAVELTCLALPTSMMLMVWISQRTDWPPLLLGLGLVLLSFSARRSPALVAVFVLLAAVALLFKETGVAVLAIVPLFTLAFHRRGRLALALAAGAAVVLAGYLVLRSRVLPAAPPVTHEAHGMVELGLGVLETLIYPSIQVCFTYDPFVLALNLIFLVMAVSGALQMLRDSRRTALGLLAVFTAYALPAVKLAEPRNLVVPGFVVAAFAVAFVERVLGSRKRGLGIAALALLLLNVGVLASLSVTSSYPLQSWIPPLNAKLVTSGEGARPRGYYYELDANTRFRVALREALRNWYETTWHSRRALPGRS